jgi:hypothetical protein
MPFGPLLVNVPPLPLERLYVVVLEPHARPLLS